MTSYNTSPQEKQIPDEADLTTGTPEEVLDHTPRRVELHGFPGVTSLRLEDVCLILPSYHMYNSLYRLVNADEAEIAPPLAPPVYLRQNSEALAPDSGPESVMLRRDSEASHRPLELSVPLSMSRRVSQNWIVADETTTQWQNTIKDNIHELKNLLKTDNATARNTKILIHFTRNVGEVGQPAVPLDPGEIEYNKRDYIHGYVLIEIVGPVEIPFDMFYLLFEGLFKCKDFQRNFLQMFDFSASSSPGTINRLATEWVNPYTCDQIIDPVDGTYVSFAEMFSIIPGRVYKRFFTFKIPEFLLDLSCPHLLPGHTCVPPLMHGTTPVGKGQYIRDFCFGDSEITYGVMARFIGRRNAYRVDEKWLKLFSQPAIVNSRGDEYIILQEDVEQIRVIQRVDAYDPRADEATAVFNKSLYANLHARAKEAIDEAKQSLNMIVTGNFDSIESRKVRQLYLLTRRDQKFDAGLGENEPVYSVTRPLVRKWLGLTKLMGTISVLLPRHTHLLDYIHPPKFRARPEREVPLLRGRRWQVQLPVTLTWLPPFEPQGGKIKTPLLDLFHVDFVVHTFRLDPKYPVPLEFHNDFVNNQVKNQTDPRAASYLGLDELQVMIDETRALLTEIYDLFQKLGPQNFKIEKQLVDDLKGVCLLSLKTNNLSVPDVRDPKGAKITYRMLNKQEWVQQSNGTYQKTFDFALDMDTMQLKGYDPSLERACDRFTLVPSFQLCFLGRMYYLRMSFGLLNGEFIHLKVPVNVSKLWAENFCHCPQYLGQ